MKWLLQVIMVALTSMYIFPIEFVFLPALNTKMIMAVLGVGVFIINSILKREEILPKKVINAALLAIGVSLIGLASVLYNGTSDYTYASYFISFIVWIFAAYFVINCIRIVHAKVSIIIVCNYLIAVAISQCVLAIMLDTIPIFKQAVNSVVVGFASMFSAGDGLEKAGRLYGIGAALDVAGTRFCAILSIIGILVYKSYRDDCRILQYTYMLLFGVLLVVGSMISRTTGVGCIFIILYYLFVVSKEKQSRLFFVQLGFCLAILIVLVSFLYNHNAFFYNNFRFAFEGFFNYFEQGEWRLNSTDTLKEMYVFPDSFKTWLIGDAYFDEPYVVDPYYVGEVKNKGLFYMGTDVGYIRFLYYFGAPGLAMFILYFITITKNCISDFPNYKWIFIAFLMMNLLIWFKVATDIFCLFALFLCFTQSNEDLETHI